MSIRIGVQMYTLRSKLKSPETMEEAFRRIHAMGARCVQAYPIPSVAAVFLGELSRKYDLPICTVHADFHRIQNDLDRLAEEFLTFECKAIGIGMMPAQYRTKGLEGAKAFTQVLNETGNRLRQYGMDVTYHNHSFEFKAINGQTLFGYMVENTEPYVQFTPDVYWIKVGGYEPESVLENLSGRTRVMHLKDYKKGIAPLNMREIGGGTLDFPSILRCAEKAGVRDAVVELDWARSPYRSLENSLRFLGLQVGA